LTTVIVSPDGCLPVALDRLYAAVAGLVDPIKQMLDGAIMVSPSWYEQLVGAITPRKGEGMGRLAGRSVPPVWLDAVDLRVEIDDQTKQWQPDIPTTPARLRAVAARAWRPQDTRTVDAFAGHVESWAVSVRSLLNPTPVKQLAAACPACDKRTVYRRDSAGELVRQPALQIGVWGCECMACHAFWAPDRFVFLARVLGYDLPAGVLE
jgi:hypothetical protein